MKKFLLCLTILTLAIYGAEDIIKKDIQQLKNARSTTLSAKFHLENQNNTLASRKYVILNQYQKIEAQYAKKSIDEKALLLQRYKCINDLLDNLFYSQALLDLIELASSAKLHPTAENLLQRKIKFANDYNISSKANGLDKQKISAGLQDSANLFNDIKDHNEKIQSTIRSRLEKYSA